jgi:FKBP-type peptidyl-prolyl cis-trans isomerase
VENNSSKSFYDQFTQFFRNLFGSKVSDKSESVDQIDSLANHSHEHSLEKDQTHEHTHTEHSHAQAPKPSAEPAHAALTTLDLSLFHKIDTLLGNGAQAFEGAQVSVHYTGWLIDTNALDLKGQKFDSSVDRGQTFNFPLGAGHVIKGWDEGFAGMRIGGKRTLLIPSEMGYGARGAGGVIPPNATLIFEVELLGVE